MRISAKGRYGLCSMVYLAQNAGTSGCINLLKISEDLGISKIYLEQVFSLLKKAGLVLSIKGASGGYQLSRNADAITAFDILNAIEITLFEAVETSTSKQAGYIEDTLQSILWKELDHTVISFLSGITLEKLSNESLKRKKGMDFMYFI